MIFGAAYDSAAVVPDGTPPPAVSDPVTQYAPVARPGRRAPHVWLERAGEPLSTLDLIGPRFALLAGPEGKAWCDAGRAVAAGRSLPLEALSIGGSGDVDDRDGRWPAAYGIEPGGAVIIRPDGHVAWRSPRLAPDPRAELERAFGQLLGRAAGG